MCLVLQRDVHHLFHLLELCFDLYQTHIHIPSCECTRVRILSQKRLFFERLCRRLRILLGGSEQGIFKLIKHLEGMLRGVGRGLGRRYCIVPGPLWTRLPRLSEGDVLV